MVEELMDKGFAGADEKMKRGRMKKIALAAIFIIAAVLFIGWQMNWFGMFG